MEHQRRIVQYVPLLLVVVLAGCASSTTQLYNDAMSLYRKNNLQEALPKFEQLASQRGDAGSYAWLAETYRRLGKNPEALANARISLRLDPCNSFAHTVMADASNPMYGTWDLANSDTTWTHLQQAVACNPDDGNAWLSLSIEAMKKQDTLMVHKALRGLVTSGFLAPPALSLGRWMLRALPPGAVLVTNGDMDTFPLWAVQETEGFRKDVSVVNRSLLNSDEYERYVRDVIGLPVDQQRPGDVLPDTLFPAGRIFRMWMIGKSEGTFARPVAIACTVDQPWYEEYKHQFHYCGPFLFWSSDEDVSNTVASSARASLEGVTPGEFIGSFVSKQDRSPVRIVYTDGLAQQVIWTAMMNSSLSLRAGDRPGAKRWLDWAEELDAKAATGSTAKSKIDELRKELK